MKIRPFYWSTPIVMYLIDGLLPRRQVPKGSGAPCHPAGCTCEAYACRFAREDARTAGVRVHGEGQQQEGGEKDDDE